jgi:pimeloyl-ACP methyl ester carboxylesterase
MSPTIVLVHGAFADASSWNAVAGALAADGHRVVGYANPLRGVADDAAGLTALVRSLSDEVVLVGHSYGGALITNVPRDAGRVVGLVYVAAFALDAGESAGDVSASVPGSTLGETLTRVPLVSGTDLYITPERFHQQFCADLPAEQGALMAITQRPVTEAALGEASGPDPLWRHVPSWFVFGDADRNIPVAAHRAMAARAGAVDTVEIAGGSHVVGMSHPDQTVALVRAAASGGPGASR